MKIGVLGTGVVGTTIASKLVEIGHDVCMGSRRADNPAAKAWAEGAGPHARVGTFADAAAFAEALFNCVAGVHSLAALDAAGEDNLDGKVLIDLANPLDFSQGMPPRLTVCNTDSLAESIQRGFPGLKVVKSLNTMNCAVMVDPGRVPGEHDVFVSGDDPEARALVSTWLREWFGWHQPIDLGSLATARGVEAWLPLWVSLYSAFGSADFNLKIVRAATPAQQEPTA